MLSSLKKVWFLNFLRRVFNAARPLFGQFISIIKWGFESREDTNFTYPLTAANELYLAQTLSVVTSIDIKTITSYIEEAKTDEALKSHILATTKKSEHRFSADNRVDFAKRLGWYAFARALKPKVIVETGVDKGLGSVLLCAALLKNRSEGFDGYYFGTDININAGYLLHGKYAEVGEILFGDSVESLSKLNKTIDLFINDSDHSADYEMTEYRTIAEHLTDRSVLLGDNAHATDKLARFSAETGRDFLFWKEVPKGHWYGGAGIGISFKKSAF